MTVGDRLTWYSLAASMLAEERRGRLLEMVRVGGFASLRELADQLEVSESTVRRDLDFLEDSGSAKRTHGGVFYTGPSPKLPHFDARQSLQWQKKREIAQAAALLIEDGDSVLLDGGTTTYELAQLLLSRCVQVVTNSLPVANLLTTGDRTDLVLVGGNVHTQTGVAIGPYANRMLAELNVRRAVLSVSGVHDTGYYNSSVLLVETERAMMQSADEVIVVADSTKFGHKGLAHLCDLGGVNVLVVDNEISEDWRSKLIAAGVKLVVAGASDNANAK